MIGTARITKAIATEILRYYVQSSKSKTRNMSTDTEILELALELVYERLDSVIELLQSGEQKKAIVVLRQILPKGYTHSFEKVKVKGPK